MKYLITGITGFAGPHLANLLHNCGHEVHGLIRGSNGMETDILDVVPEKIFSSINFIYGDLKDIRSMQKVFDTNYDGVFHLVPKKVLSEPLAKMNDIKEIPTSNLYNGIPLVMISEQAVIKYNQQSKNNSLPFLYAIENYQPFNTEEINKSAFNYNNLPEKMAQQYSQDYTFKVLVGKQRTALFVFNQDMTIVDLQLLP